MSLGPAPTAIRPGGAGSGGGDLAARGVSPAAGVMMPAMLRPRPTRSPASHAGGVRAAARSARSSLGAPRTARRASVALALVLALAPACGDQAPGPTLVYEGEAGQPVAFQLINGVPAIVATIDEGAEQLLLVDTGSPLTLLSQRAFPERSAGTATVRLGAFGLAFPAAPIAMGALFASESPCAGPTPAGLVGGDLLQQFSLELDFGALQLALAAGAPRPVPGGEAPALQEVPFRLRGGGTVRLGDDVKVRVGPSRVVVPLRVEGQPVEALLDTGSTRTLISDSLLRRLPAAGRPLICCETVETATQGALAARVTRLRGIELGTVQLADWAVLVLPEATPFAALSRETGRPITMVIGSDVLQRLVSQLDYPARRWRVGLRSDAPPAPVDAYLGPGFTFCAARDGVGALVQDVLLGSDGFVKGVRTGERLLAIGGVDLAGLDRAAMLDLLQQTPLGQAVRLKFSTAGGVIERTVRVEQLLPPFS